MKMTNSKMNCLMLLLFAAWLVTLFPVFTTESEAASTEKKYGDEKKVDPPQAPAKPQTPQEFFLAAIKAFQAGNSHNAEAYCLKAIAMKPRFADAHYLLGKIYLYRAAEKNRLEIRNFGVNSPETNYVRRYLKGREELLRAHSEFDIVVQIQPKAADAWLNLGICEDNLGNDDAGIKAYRKAIELSPLTTIARDAHNNLGLTLQTKGDSKGALKAFQMALRIDPTFSPSRINMKRLIAKFPKLKKEIE
jgi:tetratricopeptide (TPR) repeat protein